MIKNNTTICGKELNLVSLKSHKKVIRICDICGKEDLIQVKDLTNQHQRLEKRNLPKKDICNKCHYDIYPGPNKGIKLSNEQRLKMSLTKKEINKLANRKYTKIVDGYAIDYSLGKQIMIHRKNYEEFYNEKLTKNDIIHHINIKSLDNRPENLIKLTSEEHSQLHRNLEKLAAELIQVNLIKFDRLNKQYYLDPELKLKTLYTSLSFDDIAIKQKENINKSRLDVNIDSEVIKGINLKIPLIAANMSTVTNAEFCIKLSKLGALGVLHRAFTNVSDYWDQTYKIAKECEFVAVSVGVGEDQINLAKDLINYGANIIVIDIAHGFSESVFETAKAIKNYASKTKIVIGNTTNINILTKGLRYIDAIKVGIANGLACETKDTAGCNEGQFSTVFKFKQISKDLGIPIISDGAIRSPSDFTKAIAAGANSAMAGSIFAKCPESAAEVFDGKKLYAGMASRYVQEKWKGSLKEGTCPEGKVIFLPIGEPVDKLIERYSGALKSGITYGGGNDIKSFQDNVEFVRLK